MLRVKLLIAFCLAVISNIVYCGESDNIARCTTDKYTIDYIVDALKKIVNQQEINTQSCIVSEDDNLVAQDNGEDKGDVIIDNRCVYDGVLLGDGADSIYAMALMNNIKHDIELAESSEEHKLSYRIAVCCSNCGVAVSADYCSLQRFKYIKWALRFYLYRCVYTITQLSSHQTHCIDLL